MNRFPIAVTAFAGLLLSASAVAQDVRKVDPRERLEREVDEKAQRLRDGHVMRTNVRVAVRLENGSRLRGVVKNGRFIERHDGLTFVPSDLSVEGAGVRLWYTDQTNGFVFLPYASIQSHTIGDVLSDDEVREIGLRMEELDKARKARAAERATVPGPQSLPPGMQAPPPAAEPPAADDGPKLTPEQQKLLDEYPPDAGWSYGKLQQLERDKIIIDRFPNEKEARFIEVFDQWNEAFQIWEQAKRGAAGGDPASGGGPLPGGVVPGGGPAPATPPGGATGGTDARSKDAGQRGGNPRSRGGRGGTGGSGNTGTGGSGSAGGGGR